MGGDDRREAHPDAAQGGLRAEISTLRRDTIFKEGSCLAIVTMYCRYFENMPTTHGKYILDTYCTWISYTLYLRKIFIIFKCSCTADPLGSSGSDPKPPRPGAWSAQRIWDADAQQQRSTPARRGTGAQQRTPIAATATASKSPTEATACADRDNADPGSRNGSAAQPPQIAEYPAQRRARVRPGDIQQTAAATAAVVAATFRSQCERRLEPGVTSRPPTWSYEIANIWMGRSLAPRAICKPSASQSPFCKRA